MPIDDKGRYWPEKINNTYSDGVVCYKPPPIREDEPPLLVPHSTDGDKDKSGK